LQNNPNVNINLIQEAHQNWDYRSQGLTQAGAAIVAIAVAFSTAGMGAELAGVGATGGGASGAAAGTSGGAVVGTGTGAVAGTGAGAASGAATGFSVAAVETAAANAAFTTLATQASISLINNQGDVGATLKQLGSEEGIKQLVVATLSAGATAGITSGLGVTSTAAKSAINAGVSATAQSTVNGADFEDALVTQLKFAAANIISSQASGVVSDKLGGAGMANNIAETIANAVVGCAAGAIANGSCAGGAIGAAVSQKVAEMALKTVRTHRKVFVSDRFPGLLQRLFLARTEQMASTLLI
jgi:filamentous hemagglutinin